MQNYIIYIFTILPIIILIHEIGHMLAAKCYGCNITMVTLGTGPTIIKLKHFQIKLFYFWGGLCQFLELHNTKKITKVIIRMNGSIFNLLSSLVIFSLIKIQLIPNTYLLNSFVESSMFIAIINLIPFSIFGVNTDGKQLYQLIKYGDCCYESYKNGTIVQGKSSTIGIGGGKSFLFILSLGILAFYKLAILKAFYDIIFNDNILRINMLNNMFQDHTIRFIMLIFMIITNLLLLVILLYILISFFRRKKEFIKTLVIYTSLWFFLDVFCNLILLFINEDSTSSKYIAYFSFLFIFNIINILWTAFFKFSKQTKSIFIN